MKYIRYRHFIDAFMTEDEAKAEAAEIEVDCIDDKGMPAKRPGLVNDFLPSPYPNMKAAEAANNGAEPPDLSLMGWAREGGDDYVFNLLTGFDIYLSHSKGLSVLN
jgi:ubiquinol-cytochrome c reductase cytochrome c1 subunit